MLLQVFIQFDAHIYLHNRSNQYTGAPSEEVFIKGKPIQISSICLSVCLSLCFFLHRDHIIVFAAKRRCAGYDSQFHTWLRALYCCSTAKGRDFKKLLPCLLQLSLLISCRYRCLSAVSCLLLCALPVKRWGTRHCKHVIRLFGNQLCTV